MKKISFLFCLILMMIQTTGQVKIGTNPGVINPASLLELESNSKGLLPPRMINSDMRSIINPPKGLMVFNTTDSALYLRRDTGWVRLSTFNNCAFYAALNTNQAVANYTFTSLLPYVEYYDQGANFDPSLGRFTARDAGIYHFEMSIVLSPQATNTIYGIQTFINGVYTSQKFEIVPSFTASFNSSLQFTFDVKLNANDVFTFQFLQRTGTTINVQGAGSTEPTYFSGFKVF